MTEALTWQKLLYIRPPVGVCQSPRWRPGDIGSIRLQGGGSFYVKRGRPPSHPLYYDSSNGGGRVACQRCPGCIAYSTRLHKIFLEEDARLLRDGRLAMRQQAAKEAASRPARAPTRRAR